MRPFLQAIKMKNLTFPTRLELARTPTPFYVLERLSERLGGPRIWVKRDDLTECAASGNKIRKLEFTLARALEAGCDTVITSGGVQSNHCRATALLGARLGLKVHLILRDEGEFNEFPDGNLLLDYLAGAEVSIYPKARYFRDQEAIVDHWRQHYQQQGKTPWIIPVGASDGHGVWGYINCARELVTDFQQAGIAPEIIFHATGSGGTQAGLTVGAHLLNMPSQVIGMAVCDNARYFVDKVHADLDHWREAYGMDVDVNALKVSVNDSYIGPGYAQATEEVFATIRLAAETEGLVFDPVYTGKAFHGMIEEIRGGRLKDCKNIVFVHTGGIFGLMAQGASLGYKRDQRLS
jgi:D-cysteine desulfhydrase